MNRFVDLNADVGEGVGDDAALIPLLTSANIACGAHAGDTATMRTAVQAALAAGVVIGAHPGHADREGFGRRALPLTSREAAALVRKQVERLQRIARPLGGRVAYVKLHGALYHQASRDRPIAESLAKLFDDLGLASLGQPGGELHAATYALGGRFFAEAFADRGYAHDGTLLPRGAEGAVIESPEQAAEQAVRLVVDGLLFTGAEWSTTQACDSLCLHGDQANAVACAEAVRDALTDSGVELRPFAT